MSLYRKHRPQKFSDIIGQEHIKKVLTNALKQGKAGHAYLFSGPRGTGKTSMARLLAKSLNCHDDKNHEPCNDCISCKEITDDKSLDVIEIDAASNRGIDEIRELRDKVRFAPSNSAYKVYIIDEVHMLTKEAFNALLKTLEEPPAHAVFIMATTELFRVPDTILSRSQQFDFKRASHKELIENLSNISKKEKLFINTDALKLIASAGDGSFRDSVSILDQVASLGESEVNEEHIKEILGLVSNTMLNQFLEFIDSNQVKKAIDLINQIFEQGYDLNQFNQTIIESLRQKMLESGDYGLLEKIKKFIKAGQDMKYAQVPQIPLELAVIEVANQESRNMNQGETDSEKLIAKSHKEKIITKEEDQEIKQLEERKDIQEESTENLKSEISNHKPIQPIDTINLKEKWPEIINEVAINNHSLSILLKDAQPIEIKGSKLILSVKFKFYAERISESEKYNILTNAIEKVLVGKFSVECVVKDNVKVKSQKEKVELKSNIESQAQISNPTLVDEALDVFGE